MKVLLLNLKMNKRLAVLRIRGSIGVDKKIQDTLNMLRLYRKNYCSIVPNNHSYIGMLSRVKDYVTWGEIDKETFKLLLEKRGKIVGNKSLNEHYVKEKSGLNIEQFSEDFLQQKKDFKDIPGIKQFFRLKPPTKGFERGGIKKPFSLGGALGYRKNHINDLIRRMI